MRENIKKWKASLEGTLNVDKWGGQIIFYVEPVLRKMVQVCNFTYSKNFLKLLGWGHGPPITNVALPLDILINIQPNYSLYIYIYIF